MICFSFHACLCLHHCHQQSIVYIDDHGTRNMDAFHLATQVDTSREKPERGHAAVLRGTLFLGRIAALTKSIFELAELHSRIHFRCYGKWPAWSVLDLHCGIVWTRIANQARRLAPVWPRCDCPPAIHNAWTVESL